VKSRTTAQFRKLLAGLPEEIQEQARMAYRQFSNDPWYSSLHFKAVHPNEPIYSVRITKGYRALGKRDKKGILWFWVGSHSDYDKLLKRQ
jgi:hypothetical protein